VRAAQPAARAKWQAAAAGLIPLASVAAPGLPAGCGSVPCSRQSVRRRASSVSRPDISHERGIVLAPDVFTYRAAVGACEMGQQRRQAAYLLRAMQRQATVQVVAAWRAAVSACEKGPAASAGLTPLTGVAAPLTRMWVRTARPSARAKGASSDSRPFISCERCRARPSGRGWLRTVPPSVRTKRGSSVSRPDFSYERCSAFVPDVSTYGAAVSSFVYSGSCLAPPISVADHGGGCFVIRFPRIWYQPALSVWWRRHPYSCQHVCIECGCRQASGGWWVFACAGMPLVGTGER